MRTFQAVIIATGLLAAAPVFAQTTDNTPGGPVEQAPVFARGKPESQGTVFSGNTAGQSGRKRSARLKSDAERRDIAIEAKGQRIALEQSEGNSAYATYVVEYVGAGSIVDPSGLIITNRHVVKEDTRSTLRSPMALLFRRGCSGPAAENGSLKTRVPFPGASKVHCVLLS